MDWDISIATHMAKNSKCCMLQKGEKKYIVPLNNLPYRCAQEKKHVSPIKA